ncbi:GNAT family N-acetyltransferase [Variovorax saccharolyticus]|uniref:GNAT family N-acetyltransferase n=1 Tax=Variovorax saccharolyticus TaxID=3053516 RepID=UPI002576EF55|nr:GNAT family N-acetyltransferase [Variovorax sp. J22R187]MDM0019390.1 GNAT family N-acetyltransferase [Variovorax sp. J22R187]
MEIRRFRPGDEAALFRVYFTAIHEIASRDYAPEQVEAWAPADLDTGLWARRVRGINPFVAELGDEIVGYADVQQNGYIDHFFVSGAHPRQGIGTRLMARIHEEAEALGLAELSSDVSKTAEPFFALHGFHVVERRCPVLRGVTLENAWMRKDLKQRG